MMDYVSMNLRYYHFDMWPIGFGSLLTGRKAAESIDFSDNEGINIKIYIAL